MPGLPAKVLILGHGEMSLAMQHLLGGHHQLVIWARRPRDGSTPLAPERLVADCDVVIFCLPTEPHFDLLTRLRPALTRRTLCLSIAKGLDVQGRTPAAVFAQVLAAEIPYAVLYGPMISEEIRRGKPGFAQVAATSHNDLLKTTALFQGSALHTEPSSDGIGLSWSAILKNVYAILFGIADELQLGDNMRGHLTAAALMEIGDIIRGFGGLPTTAYHWAGLGDLITTATSSGSYHYQLGRSLARDPRAVIRGEGAHTLHILRSRALVAFDTHPLLNLVETCMSHAHDIPRHLQKYLDHLDQTAWARGARVGTDGAKMV